MVSEQEHINSIREFEEDIKEKINKGIAVERQRIIGFSITECARHYLELYLHKQKLISEGTNINHRWFSSRKTAEDKFPFDFQHKNEILTKMVELENKRNLLCYGKKKPEKEIEESIKLFFDIKNLIEKELGEFK